MRISDWSSDVCSSDLPPIGKTVPPARQTIAELLPCATAQEAKRQKPQRGDRRYRQAPGKAITSHQHLVPLIKVDGQARTDRKSVVEGKSVSVRVDLGGRGIIKQKK